MRDKPNFSDFEMSIRDQILIKTIMEMTEKFEVIRSGLENSNWSEITRITTSGSEYSRFNLSENTWAELMDLARLYITAHPELEWLSSTEKQYISEDGFQYTKTEKKKYWNSIGSGAGEYMSEWHKIHLGVTCENREDSV